MFLSSAGGQFAPVTGGQFESATGGQLKSVGSGQVHRFLQYSATYLGFWVISVWLKRDKPARASKKTKVK